MADISFRAFVVEEAENGQFVSAVRETKLSGLPEGEVTVRVHYSSLNYKDALSATGNKGVTRKYPHTPGIDAAGIVTDSLHPDFKPGDEVIVTGYDLGMNTPGGFGRYIRVPAAWVVGLSRGLTLKESMVFGTAGFTAAMCALKIAADITPDQGDILVTGASGGVGTVSVAILARLGYRVFACSGKISAEPLLKELGAVDILGREELLRHAGQPLLKPRWAGVVDTVGGQLLAQAIKATRPCGCVTCCGNAASPDLSLTVYPFILRGVSLIGIDSQNCPMPLRRRIWEKLADDWKFDLPPDFTREISLQELATAITAMLDGQSKGRTVVSHDATATGN